MRPDRRALAVLGAWLFVSVAAAVWRPLQPIAYATAGMVFALLAVDLLRARRLPEISATRTVSTTLALRNWCNVRLRIESETGLTVRMEVFDHYPVSGEVDGLPRIAVLPPGRWTELGYRFRPLQRGAWSFGQVELWLRSPWGLWAARRRAGQPSHIRVYPDFKTVQRYAILAVDNAVSRLGVRRKQRRGEGLELRQLREYRDGDSLRQIDWKATSRRLKLISREYDDERNQQIVFMLDCSRNMRSVDRGLSHFDHALNCVLLLTYVAARQGDGVGLMTLGGTERWLPPQKGPSAVAAMLRAIYDLETRPVVPDYTTAATRLMALQRRRALVVLVSNLRDEDGSEVASAVRLLRRRHLVLVASLREAVLDEVLEEEVCDFRNALLVAGTHHYLAARRKSLAALQGRGIHALDVTPGDLPLALVNRYLDIKRNGML